MEIFRKILSFLNTKPPTPKERYEDSVQSPEQAYLDSFYGTEDLVYLKNLNAYGIFRYKVVKDVLSNSDTIGVSNVHLSLNRVYFSLEEKKHQHNKRAAIQNLGFLSKKNQHNENNFTEELFQYLVSKFPSNQPFDLVDYLINPLIFINILNEFAFLQYMPAFNPKEVNFDYKTIVNKIKVIFEDHKEIEKVLREQLQESGQIPEMMSALFNDININHDIDPSVLPGFFSSMIYASTDSTSSFISSFIYNLFEKNPDLAKKDPGDPEMEKFTNEILRIYTPVPYIYRTVRKETVFRGVHLKVDDTVIVFIGSANLDPYVFTNPGEINLDRTEKHLSFGRNQYACIGQHSTYRLAVHIHKYMSNISNDLKFLDNNLRHTIRNGMLRIPLLVVYTPNIEGNG